MSLPREEPKSTLSQPRPGRDQRSPHGSPFYHHENEEVQEVLNGTKMPIGGVGKQGRDVEMFLVEPDFKLTKDLHEMRMFRIRRNSNHFNGQV